MKSPTYQPHHGDQSLVRPGYVEHATALLEQMQKFAITEHHPAAQALYVFEAELTTAEWRAYRINLVQGFRPARIVGLVGYKPRDGGGSLT